MELVHIEGAMVLSLFIGYLGLWRRKKRQMVGQNGENPEVIYADDRPTQQFFIGLSRVMSVLVVVLIVLHSAGVKDNIALHPIDLLDNGAVDAAGFMLGVMGLLLCWRAQRDMGTSWRVGIDKKNRTALVTTGVFTRIRNPTYSGLFLICSGSFLIFPTMSFMLWIVVFYISIEFQVRLEEEFLTECHGAYYTRYYQVTKRYIPSLY